MTKRLLIIFSIIAMELCITTNVFAADTGTFNVKVSILSVANIAVAGGPIDFGTLQVATSSNSTNAVIVTNDGSGCNETYSISLVDPTNWTAVTTAPDINKYRLYAAFDSDGNDITWDPAKHAISAAPKTATSTVLAGDQTGTGVPYNEARKVYLKLETPTKSTTKDQQNIQVIVTATVD